MKNGIVEENARVLESCKNLKAGNLKAFGSLLLVTHAGLRDDYEVSCPELDYLVDVLKGDKHVFGSRMMGGGFGGCTVNIVKNEGIEQVCNVVGEKYKQQFNLNLKSYVTSIGCGTSLVAT